MALLLSHLLNRVRAASGTGDVTSAAENCAALPGARAPASPFAAIQITLELPAGPAHSGNTVNQPGPVQYNQLTSRAQ